MARKTTVEDVILEAVAASQGAECSFDDLIKVCPDLTWNQIFLEVDRLSRKGLVQLSQSGRGVYRVRVSIGNFPIIGAPPPGAVAHR